jgi:hypothetical protein
MLMTDWVRGPNGFNEVAVDARDLREHKALPVISRALEGEPVLKGPLGDDQDEIARAVYLSLLNDDYARPLYPPQGLETMARDADLVETFASAARSALQSAAGALELSGSCSSSSTSSNACSSTSTSFSISRDELTEA